MKKDEKGRRKECEEKSGKRQKHDMFWEFYCGFLIQWYDYDDDVVDRIL